MPEKLVSLLGAVVMLTCAWGLSLDRKRFPVRVVAWGLGLQLAFALLILKTTVGARFFDRRVLFLENGLRRAAEVRVHLS